MGARANGMGYASSCLTDEWSLFGNAGGLSKVEKPAGSFSYHAIPSFKSFNRTSAVFVIPLKFGVAGAGIFRFGDDIYNEQVASVAFSNTFGLASLGLKVNYIQYQAEGFGSKGVMSLGFGGIARLTPHIHIGTYITNVNQPVISSIDGERLPTRITAGLAILPGEKITVVSEIEKDLRYSVLWKTGIEYRFNKNFSARTGFNLNPDAAFGGFGFKKNKLILDYAFQYQEFVGVSHQATAGYVFNRTRK
jgi:hypothetical protein